MKKSVLIRCCVLAALIFAGMANAYAGKHHYKILPLGDSITQGSGKCTSYTYPLWKDLTKEGYDFEYIGPRTKTYDVGKLNHCGFGGKNVQFFDKKIDSLYRVYPGDVVLMHMGHNHFIEEDPVEGMIQAHKSVIDKITAINPDVYIFVAQVIPSGKLPKYFYIPEFNKELKKLVKSYHSRHIILVNQEKGFDWQTMTVDDHVHPNELGADLMAGKWAKAIKRHLKK